MPKLKTLKQWNERGRLVIKGQKADGFNEKGVALFNKAQTWKPDSGFNEDYENSLFSDIGEYELGVGAFGD